MFQVNVIIDCSIMVCTEIFSRTTGDIEGMQKQQGCSSSIIIYFFGKITLIVQGGKQLSPKTVAGM